MREIRIVEIPDLPPHRCMACFAGNTNREFFVDLGFETEFDGVIYVCNICMMHIGKGSGLFITKEDHSKELAELEAVRADYYKLLVKIEIYNAQFKVLTGNDLYDFFNSIEVITGGTDIDKFYGTDVSGNDPEPEITESTLDSANLKVELNFS